MTREELVYIAAGMIIEARAKLDMPNFLETEFTEEIILDAKKVVDNYTNTLLSIWEANNT